MFARAGSGSRRRVSARSPIVPGYSSSALRPRRWATLTTRSSRERYTVRSAYKRLWALVERSPLTRSPLEEATTVFENSTACAPFDRPSVEECVQVRRRRIDRSFGASDRRRCQIETPSCVPGSVVYMDPLVWTQGPDPTRDRPGSAPATLVERGPRRLFVKRVTLGGPSQ